MTRVQVELGKEVNRIERVLRKMYGNTVTRVSFQRGQSKGSTNYANSEVFAHMKDGSIKLWSSNDNLTINQIIERIKHTKPHE